MFQLALIEPLRNWNYAFIDLINLLKDGFNRTIEELKLVVCLLFIPI